MTISHEKPCKQLQYNDVSTTSASRKSKEPRFVPYEPYKAAVNPIVSQKVKVRQTKAERNDPIEISEEKEVRQNTNTNHEIINEKKCDFTETGELNKESDAKDMNSSNSAFNDIYASELENTKKLLAETTKKLEESEKQLNIQIQVCINQFYLEVNDFKQI